MYKIFVAAGFAAISFFVAAASAGDKPFPKIIDTPNGSAPEGFAIGNGHTAFNGSPNGSIVKIDLRSGESEVLVPVRDPDIAGGACFVLGLRYDPRTNYLYAAGCVGGNAYVYDADTGALIMEYQLTEPFTSVINDLTITRDAVYFTDSYRPVLYRLALSKNGQPLSDAGAVTEIPLPADIFTQDFLGGEPCCAGNGIVASPDGNTLVIGHSNLAKLFRVKPATGEVDEILLYAPLDGFLDGLAIKGHRLYIMTPGFPEPESRIQIVELEPNFLLGRYVDAITDPDLDDVASGAIFGNSLYVNNARYSQFPGGDTPYWITKIDLP